MIAQATTAVVVELLEMRRMLSASPSLKPSVDQKPLALVPALASSAKDSKASNPAGSAVAAPLLSGGQQTTAVVKKSPTPSSGTAKRFNVNVIDEDSSGIPSSSGGDSNETSTNLAKSNDPVNLDDGTLNFTVTDLESDGLGSSFGVTRYWTNNPLNMGRGVTMGPGWGMTNFPTLVQPDGQGKFGAQEIIQNGAIDEWFTANYSWYDDVEYDPPYGTTAASDGDSEPLAPPPQVPTSEASDWIRTEPTYTPSLDNDDQLTHDEGDDIWTFTDATGNRTEFYGFTQWATNIQGSFAGYEPALSGAAVTVVSHDADGNITEVDRTGTDTTATVPQPTVTESWTYRYNAGLLGSVTLSRQTNGGVFHTVGSVSYGYYDGSGNGGSAGELEDAIVHDGAGDATSETYYRYYLPGQANGFANGLKYAFTGQAFARLTNNLPAGTTVADARDADVAPYATWYLQYDSTDTKTLANGSTITIPQVTQESISGFGTNSAGQPGDGTIDYQYLNLNTSGPQSPELWQNKTIETYADGSTDTVYTNSVGRAILTSHRTPDGTDTSTWNEYDSRGFLIETAEPSAVTGYDDAYPDLVNMGDDGNATYLSQNAGLIYQYSWDEDSGTPLDTFAQQGSAGTPVLDEETDYASIAMPDTSMEQIVSDTLFDASTNPQQVTTYQYIPNANSYPLEVITDRSAPGGSQNGSGRDSVTTDYYDSDSNLRWEQDPNGNVSYWNYDLATGALTQSIQSVNTTTFSGSQVPDALTGAGPNLATTEQVDDQGNVTEQTDPDGNVTYYTYDYPDHISRVYPGWHQIAGTDTYTTTGPVQVTDDNWSTSLTDQLSYDPGALAESVPDGSDPIANVQTLTRTSVDASGQTVESDQYFHLSGLTYSATPNLGTAGVNYYPTTYGYNVLGYQDEVTSSTGTITQNTYDSLGRLTSTSVGTSASNLTDTADYQYDNGGFGDGNLTRVTVHPGGGAADRVTQYFYDWRDEPIGELEGAGTSVGTLLYTEYDNQGEPVLNEQFAVGAATLTAELVDSTGDGIPNGLTSNQLRARTADQFDSLGQLYSTQVFAVDPGTGAVESAATTNYFYDADGNLIASESPTGAWTKNVYNAAGEVAAQYQTDGAGGTSWTDADSVSGDHVLSQDVYQYDNDGNLITDTTSDRLATDSDSAAGSLTSGGSTGARIREQAWYYDPADRLTEGVDLGTNTGGFSYDASNPPARSSTLLATTYGYNSAGWVNEEVDPKGIESRDEYDNAGNLVETIADYTNNTPTSSSNQTTQYTYDGDGNVTSMTAIMPTGTPSQKTQYNYGGGGAVSNDLLASVEYPDPTTGAASASQTETYGYDALGEATSYTDRNGTTHQYSYDSLGHLTADQVTAFGTGVDQTVAKLGYTYTDTGQLATATSYDGTGNVLNQVSQTYDGMGQLATDAQSHSGAVVTSGTASTPTLTYAYAPGQGDRPTSMTYPNGRTITYNYGSTLDDLTSRIASISDASGTLQSYSYQGTSTPMTMIDGNGVELDTSLDHFGSTQEQDWSKGGTSLDDDSYTYDNDGNVLSKTDNVHSANSETYSYDNLNRLTSFSRADGASASYSLDATGNTSTTVTTPSPSAPSANAGTTSRTSNAQNQIVTDGNATVDYDADGNTTADENGNTLVYDAWNRLVGENTPAGAPIASYAYDPLGRRITQTQHTTPDSSIPLTSGTSTSQLLTIGAVTYMVTTDSTHGSELWVTDGTAAGSHLLDDIDPGSASSSPTNLTAVGGELFFTANDGTHGDELWKSDGTTSGTLMVADIDPGSASSSPYSLTAVGSTLFFVADDGTHGAELWKSDGTSSGTAMVADIQSGSASSLPQRLIADGSELFFSANDDTHGDELWKSDGTTSGTVMVKDIDPGAVSGIVPQSGPLFVSDGIVYFGADDGTNGSHLWRSDGTASGTAMVTTLGGLPTHFVNFQGSLYFTSGDQLYKTDGTSAGTSLVSDQSAYDSGGDGFTGMVATSNLIFLIFNQDDGDTVLYRSDGTSDGTIQINPQMPQDDQAGTFHDIQYLEVVGDLCYFRGTPDPYGTQLWVSDGSDEGTFVPDSSPTGDVLSLSETGGNLYMMDDDGSGNLEVRKLIAGNELPTISTDLYYSDRGQVIEEQQAGQTTTQYVWSPFYVNQLVERDDQPNSSGTLTRRLYVEQDANYNVTSLTDSSGNVVERYVYDPYGTVTVKAPNGTTRGDGTINSSAYGIQYLFQGGRIDPATGLYHFNARDYDPTTGRWEQQDPAAYVNGANRYQLELSDPTTLLDPTGLRGTLDAPPDAPTQSPSVLEQIEEGTSEAVDDGETLGGELLGGLGWLLGPGAETAGDPTPGGGDVVYPPDPSTQPSNQQQDGQQQPQSTTPPAPTSQPAQPSGDQSGAPECAQAATDREAAENPGNYENLVKQAQEAYPNKAGAIEQHHITPQYLGGAADGPTVPLDAAYHQQITNEFRSLAPYGQNLKNTLSPAELQQIMNDVYTNYPLPPGTSH